MPEHLDTHCTLPFHFNKAIFQQKFSGVKNYAGLDPDNNRPAPQRCSM
jgi:hypothetical protein